MLFDSDKYLREKECLGNLFAALDLNSGYSPESRDAFVNTVEDWHVLLKGINRAA